MIRLNCFGRIRIESEQGEPVKLSTRKFEQLLIYLWLRRHQSQSRDRLAGLFWPESTDKKSRASLRNALHKITKTLGPQLDDPDALLLLSRTSAQFNPDLDCWVDVGEFEEKLDSAEDREGDEAIELLSEAVSLYMGDFLEDCYEDWCLEERDYLRELYLRALHQLMLIYAERKNYEQAISCAKEYLFKSPLQEEIHRQLMMLHYANGDRNSALQQYHECAEILSDELDVEPLAETQALFEEIEARSATATLEKIAEQARDFLQKYRELGTPFAGRVQECGLLTSAWESAIAKKGKALLIGGEAGMGKTRLGQVFSEYVESQGGLALWGGCHASEGRLPYQPWLEVLRQAMTKISATALSSIAPTWLSEVLKLVPELSERFPDLKPTPPLQSPDQERNRVFEGISQIMLALSRETPLLLVLDDLQWADESTLQFAHYLARRLADQKILLLGFHRSEEVGEDHPLKHFSQAAIREQLIDEIELSPLVEEDLKEMICGMLRICEDAPVELIEQISSSTKGNPFYVVELARSYVESGAVYMDEDQTWQVNLDLLASTSPPDTVKALVDSRLRQIGRWGRELLNFASTRSRYCDLKFLQKALRRSAEELLFDLEDLVQLNFLAAQNGGYAFEHDLIREVIYQGMLPERRRWLHLKTGQALEALHKDDVRGYGDQVIGEMAHQFYEAREEVKALDYSLLAGDLAWSKSYAKDEALHHFHRAEELAEDLKDELGLARAYKGIGEVYSTTDRHEEGIVYCLKALDLCDDITERIDLYASIINACRFMRAYEQALEYCDLGLSEVDEETHTEEAAQLHDRAGVIHLDKREPKKAIIRLDRSLRLLRNSEKKQLVSSVLVNLGNSYAFMGDGDRAVQTCQEGLAIAEELGDPADRVNAYYALGHANSVCGEIDTAIGLWKRCLEIYDQMGDRSSYGWTAGRLAQASMSNGEVEHALSFAEKRLDAWEKANNSQEIALSLGVLGSLQAALDHEEDSEVIIKRALETALDLGLLYYSLTLNFSLLNMTSRAIKWLEQGLPHIQQELLEMMRTDPRFSSIQADRRFQKLVSIDPN